MLDLLNDKDSFGVQRIKINAGLTKTNDLTLTPLEYTCGVDVASGSVTSQAANAISDNTKSWTVNEHAGKGVKLVTATGEEDYAVVASNTATTLTFDDNHAGFTFATYRILFTVPLTQMNSIVAFNSSGNDGALILPDVLSVENRDMTKVYIEVAGANTKVAIICKGANRQRGRKWGTLIYQYELVQLAAHQTAMPHWDLLMLEGIERYGSFYTTAPLPVASATYTEIMSFASVTLAQSKRFDLVNVSGIAWLKYQSIIAQDFRLSGAVPIQRTGGGTTIVELKIRIKRFATGLNEDTVIRTIGDFSGDETKTVPIDIPFSLQPFDSVTVIAQRTAGTINILSGASLVFTEM